MLNGGSDIVFGPVEIGAMRQALDKASQALNFAFSEGIDASTRLQLARSIILHASAGELRASHLCALALRDLAPRAASYALPSSDERAGRSRPVVRSGLAQQTRALTRARSARHSTAFERLT
jgi:hypothetical protein